MRIRKVSTWAVEVTDSARSCYSLDVLRTVYDECSFCDVLAAHATSRYGRDAKTTGGLGVRRHPRPSPSKARLSERPSHEAHRRRMRAHDAARGGVVAREVPRPRKAGEHQTLHQHLRHSNRRRHSNARRILGYPLKFFFYHVYEFIRRESPL